MTIKLRSIGLLLAITLGLSGCLKSQESIDLADENTVFFQKNAKQAGIKTTASGLQYKIVQDGTGATAKLGDKLVVRYTGKLLNGKVFDSGDFPLTLQDGVVIEGWTEGLQLMKKGGKYTLYIPADLAYGEMSPSPDIPDNSALVFDMEILDLKTK